MYIFNLKKPLALSILLAGSAAHASEWEKHFQKMHERHAKLMEEMWKDFDDMFAVKASKAADNQTIVRDVDVSLPEVKMEQADQTLTLSIKGPKFKKDDIKVEVDEESGVAIVNLKHDDGSITLYVYPRGYKVVGQKNITHEKKDDKGKVMATSQQTAYNSVVKSFPFVVNVETVQPCVKDHALTLTLEARHKKRLIPVK